MNELIAVSDVERMAVAVAKSKLFGMKTPEEAMALMLVAQAEGLHPASAALAYHIIQGRPALKADEMLGRFQKAGGSVEWIEHTDSRVIAKFSHPSCPKGVTVDWDMKRAAIAELGGKGNWKKYPRQMLRARVISEGVRACFPSVAAGVYTPEEVMDMEPSRPEDARPVEATIIQPREKAPEPPTEPDDFSTPGLPNPPAPEPPLIDEPKPVQGGDEIAVKIEKVEIRKGEKNVDGKKPKKWRQIIIHADGKKFRKFTTPEGEIPVEDTFAAGNAVVIRAKENKYGFEILSIEPDPLGAGADRLTEGAAQEEPQEKPVKPATEREVLFTAGKYGWGMKQLQEIALDMFATENLKELDPDALGELKEYVENVKPTQAAK